MLLRVLSHCYFVNHISYIYIYIYIYILSIKVAFRNDCVILVGKTALIASFLHCSVFVIYISIEKKKIKIKFFSF